jgi:hypothetical protein
LAISDSPGGGADFPAKALGLAASRVAPRPGKSTFQERSLEDALVEALRELAPGLEPAARRHVPELQIPEWDPQPGAIDVVAKFGDSGWLAFELKVDDIDDSVWDIAKLASLRAAHPDDTVAVVAVAAPRDPWQRDQGRAAGLYDPTASRPASQAWEMRFLIHEYERSWRRALTYNPRPLRLPSIVHIWFLGAWAVPAFPGYELRAVAVDATEQDLILSDGWPVPDPKTITDEDLTLGDIPEPDAELHRLLLFAVTTNGYANYGNAERLGAFATQTYERWEQAGELPESLAELRSCLFYHQRADHFGFPLDESYARQVVGQIRTLVKAQDLPSGAPS